MAKVGEPLTALGCALLGQISLASRSGYALRKVFETTPMGSYSGSPGSIYPALKGLQARGLVRIVGPARGGRYEITSAGAEHLDHWLRQPVTIDEVSRRLDLALLRFAFLMAHPDRGLTQDFLQTFQAATSSRAQALKAYIEIGDGAALPLQARLAVEHGQRTLEASSQWAADSLRRLAVEGER